MTYRDEIVDEVRAIREQLCNQAGSLDNLLVILRGEETAHPGRIARNINVSGKSQNSDLHRVSVFGKRQNTAVPLCAEEGATYANSHLQSR